MRYAIEHTTRFFFTSIFLALFLLVSASAQAEFLGYTETDTPQDREEELHRIADEEDSWFRRVYGSGSSWIALCERNGMRAQYVMDWEGRRHGTNTSAKDGSRMVFCR